MPHAGTRGIAAQVEIESQTWKHFTTFQYQNLSPKRLQYGHQFNLHCHTTVFVHIRVQPEYQAAVRGGQ